MENNKERFKEILDECTKIQVGEEEAVLYVSTDGETAHGYVGGEADLVAALLLNICIEDESFAAVLEAALDSYRTLKAKKETHYVGKEILS